MDRTSNLGRATLATLLGVCLFLIAQLTGGCASKPSQANIELRRQIQSLDAQVADLNRRHDADAATIRALQQQSGPVQPSLPQERLEKLFTVHGLSFGRLTGGADLDQNKPGDEGVKVYIVPTDDAGQPLKAAGSFVIELFDLNKPGDNLVGRWAFSTEQARQNWFGHALLYTYVLTCPWQNPPEHRDLTLKATFRDELTGREFSIQKVITVNLPSGPTTR
jgi:hypothetical protein